MDLITSKFNERLKAVSQQVLTPGKYDDYSKGNYPMVWLLVYQSSDLSKDVFRYAVKEMLSMKTFPTMKILVVLSKVPTANGMKKPSELSPNSPEIANQEFELSIQATSYFRTFCDKIFPEVHVEPDDKIPRGICNAARRLGITRLFLARKKEMFSKSKVKEYCLLHRPSTCGLVIFNGGKLEIDIPPETSPDVADSFSALRFPSISEDSFSDSGYSKDDGSADFSGRVLSMGGSTGVSHFDQSVMMRVEEFSPVESPSSQFNFNDTKYGRVHKLKSELSVALKNLEEAKEKASKLADSSIQAKISKVEGSSGMKKIKQEIESTIQKAMDAESSVKEMERLLHEAMVDLRGKASPLKPIFKRFNGEEISKSCNYFDLSMQIGEGPFGIVYKGVYQSDMVAIKKLKNSDSWKAMTEIQKQGELHGIIQHPNVILIKGICIDPPCFVYELVEEKSLFDHLFFSSTDDVLLNWKTRFNIFCEIVSGINYLHHCDPPIFHVDLKPANILFDKDFKVKINDYRLTLFLMAMDKGRSFRVLSEAFGTYGYVCPSFRKKGMTSSKTDVFSIGMILWDLLLGLGMDGNPNLRPWTFDDIKKVIDSKKKVALNEILDPLARWPSPIAFKLSEIADSCVDDDVENRPSLTSVLVLLKDLKEWADKWDESKSGSMGSVGKEEGEEGVEGEIEGEEDEDEDGEDLRKMLVCPISQTIMQDPVIASDGHTYERKAIEKWLQEYEISPLSGKLMPSKVLLPNKSLRAIIKKLTK